MDRVSIDVGILTPKSNSYHREIVDMFQVFTNSLLRMFGTVIANYQIPGRPESDLIRNMIWEDELAFIPSNFSLFSH